MNIKQKIITFVLFIVATIGIGVVASSSSVLAAKCGGADTAIISCSQGEGGASAKDTGVWGVLIIALNIMTAGVGILAVGGIVYGSILYASAGDKAEQTKKAITTITNVVIGVVAYGLMYLILNFLVPGGIFT